MIMIAEDEVLLNLAIMQWREENFPDEYPVTALY
jgi:hypothetical protein